MPSLCVSDERVAFSAVQCGQCQIRCVQLHNQLPVPCEWSSVTQEPKTKVDKHTPLHLRNKLRQEVAPRAAIFEVMPSRDLLLPGQKKNIQIKFQPLEEKPYSQRLVLQVTHSSQRVTLMVQGDGLEPRLEFTPSVLHLGPVLPLSPGDDLQVVVKNPCEFPIEFYSLEMDKQHLEEEKILRMVKGYDAQNTLLLPPRLPREKLPPEILDFYEEKRRDLEEQNEEQQIKRGPVEEAEDKQVPDTGNKQDLPPPQQIPEGCSSHAEIKAEDAEEDSEKKEASGREASCSSDTRRGVGELELSPVSQAVARFMGVDTSGEGRAAGSRRGMAIVVHGAPLTGKSSTAEELAQHYGVVCLSLDSVVLEAISDGNSRVGRRARHLCAKAAIDQSLREAEEEASQAVDIPSGQLALSMEAVAKHTAEGGQGAEVRAAPQSVVSRGNQTSLQAGKGKGESHPGGKLTDPLGSLAEGSSPLPGPSQRRLSVSASVAGEHGLVSCVLPDDLLMEILSDRLQLSDCFGGVVFDGLETLFARHTPSALHIILRALNNRRHIYVINLKQDYSSMKARERAQRQLEEEEELLSQVQDRAKMEDMDEEEYDLLPAEERERIDRMRLQAVRQRKRRELEERLAREEEKRKLQEELLKQKEEEELKKKLRRGKSRNSGKEDKEGKKSQVGSKQTTNTLTIKSEQHPDYRAERKVSINRSDSAANDAEETKKKKSKEVTQHVPMAEDPETRPLSDHDKQLIHRFRNYESSQKDISHILTFWDRVQGILLSPPAPEDGPHEGEELLPERHAPSGKRHRKDRERDRQEKLEREKAEKERMEKMKSMEEEEEAGPRQAPEQENQDIPPDDVKALKIGVGIPHYDLQVTGNQEPMKEQILQSWTLPSVEELLEGLGLGSSGPPIPPPYIFSVVPFPDRRGPPTDQETLSHFTFLAASPDDPNVIVEEKKDADPEPDPPLSIPPLKEEQLTPTKSRSKKERGGDTGRESQKDKRRSSSLRKNQQNQDSRSSPPPGARTPVSDQEISSQVAEAQPGKVQRLGLFRWVVPAEGQVLLRIHFQSAIVGNFDQTLNFELVGTRRRYQLYCRGVCSFPTISQNPKIVFPHRKKDAKSDEIVQKKFILSRDTFDFGPLLCGKSREKYKAGQYPENMERLTIYNVSPMESEVTFCFQHDVKAATFILDPPSMALRPNEKQDLSIWAYPTTPGLFEDNIVCCIKDNPEPVLFHLCCRGVRPELDLDRKQVHFEKILLHRKDTKTIFLRNSTFLPAAWRITGLENVGDDFSVSQDQGIVAPRSEYPLQVHFRAAKATNIKKFIRLEVSDVENILGIVQLENIHVFAESYDVSLDISFPKGTDGGLDFGVVKVMEEVKHNLSLKNKGKYEIGFSFSLESSSPGMPNLNSIFTILPQKGTLSPNERATQVQIIFQAKEEMQITDKPALKCQVIEPILSDGGEIIASIPIRLSASSTFSRYRVTPPSHLDFGALVVGSRRILSVTLENLGLLEFRYNISKMIGEATAPPTKKGLAPSMRRSRSREGSGSSKSVAINKTKRTESQQREAGLTGQARLALGMFVVSPGSGSIAPGGQQVISVECLADQVGRSEEFLAIEISERNPEDHPGGITFRLLAEGCTPGFVTDDIGSIFEEHRIVEDSRALQRLPPLKVGGIFVREENRFVFWNVSVGRTCCARFKISNPGKVSCEVTLSAKPASSKPAARISDVFEVQPPRMTIPSHSHGFVSLTFTPHAMHMYHGIFEATVDPPSSLSKSQVLTFDICGEGNLPRVSVLRPALRNKQGQPLLLFQRLLIGRSQQLPLILKNEGPIPAQVNIDLPECGQTFTLKPNPNTQSIYPGEGGEEGCRVHTASLMLLPGGVAEFLVTFCPSEPHRCDSALQVTVLDNPYEKSKVQLVGEGYLEDLTLDNIHSPGGGATPQREVEEEEIVQAARTDLVDFGDCQVAQQYQATFTMTNRSVTDTWRFEWPQEAPLEFSPQVGHIHAGCTKDVTVTMKSAVAVALYKSPARCRVSRISFALPVDQVPDWDDRMRTVKWVDGGKGAQRPTKKKVIETDPEPEHTVLEDSSRHVELLVSVAVDYAQYKAKCEDVHFRDTLLYQNRVYKFLLQNVGSVRLEFSWEIRIGGRSRSSDKDPPGSGRSSSLHSPPCGALESVTSLLSPGVTTSPFCIQPSAGSIPSGESQEFLITFCPLEVGEFEGHVTCRIQNLAPGQPETHFLVTGCSLLPFCHFQLEESDYITGGRRNPELPGPRGAPSGTTLDTNTRVMEFTSVGVRTRNVRTFSIVNPTSTPHSFLWTCEDPPTLPQPPAFRCLIQQGLIQSEKKVEVTFEFVPQVLDVVESFWSFTIPEQQISAPFLLVGKCLEPSVSLDTAHLNFHSLLIGKEVQESVFLISDEKKVLGFRFQEGERRSLWVTPREGAVPPLGRVPIVIHFLPSEVGEVNLNLVCDIQTKMEPLTLNVKAEVHDTQVSIQCQDNTGTITSLSTHKTNDIDLGQVDVNDSSALQFHIINNGKFPFHFGSALSTPRGLQEYLRVTPSGGCVTPGGRGRLSLTFCPTKRCLIRDTQLVLRVEGGPELTCHIRGAAVCPGVHFSFTEFNFGRHFIFQEGMKSVRTSLLITNQEDRDVGIDCLYSNTAHMMIEFSADVLPPGGQMEVPITFYPRAAILYQETLIFQMNGHSRQELRLRGHGIEMKVEVSDPRYKVTHFGAVIVGQTVRRKVTIVNRSVAPVTCSLSLTSSVPALLDPQVLSLSPTSAVTIPAHGGLCHLELGFSPRSRVAPFAEEVVMECEGAVRSLLVIRGSSQGLELSLDQEHVAFGAVVLQSQVTRRVTLSNVGELGASFKWDMKKFQPDFSISPVAGYITPGSVITFRVTFHPQQLSSHLHYDNLPCFIEGNQSLSVTLTGSCVEVQPIKEVVNFQCPVRSKQTQTIFLSNKTNDSWALRPIIEGEHWRGPEVVTVEAHQQNKSYEVTYLPQVMSSEGKKHQGSIFFPLSDGRGLMYLLSGTAEPPKSSGTIVQEVPCKTSFTQLLTVTNWLRRAQRFRVLIEMMKPERLEATTVKGLDFLEVPGSSGRDYKLHFHSHKEGTFTAKVTFRNEVTQEYLFYNVTFRATPPGVLRTINLVTPVRQSTIATVTVENPLSAPVTFTTDCRVPEINLPPQITVPAQSEGTVTFEYQPLKSGESAARLTLHSAELGSFQYDLLLKATAAVSEKPLYFQATLGSFQALSAKFTNYTRQKAEYSCKVDHADFSVDKVVTAAPGSQGGSEVSVEVTYEPVQLGESRAVLSISSPLGGDYIIPLFGSALGPKPQGPIQIRSGSNVSIPFKNVFLQPTTFTFQAEPPAFSVRQGEAVRPKRTHHISVSYEAGGNRAPTPGRLVVSCPRTTGATQPIYWVYYLRGVASEK